MALNLNGQNGRASSPNNHHFLASKSIRLCEDPAHGLIELRVARRTAAAVAGAEFCSLLQRTSAKLNGTTMPGVPWRRTRPEGSATRNSVTAESRNISR